MDMTDCWAESAKLVGLAVVLLGRRGSLIRRCLLYSMQRRIGLLVHFLRVNTTTDAVVRLLWLNRVGRILVVLSVRGGR